jgi:hypothetical protein
LSGVWNQLRSRDGSVAWEAMGRLASAPNHAVLYLKQQLERKTASQEQVNQLVAKVDSAVFSVRAKAIDELADMLPEVEPFIQKALDEASSLEARRRLEPLLKTSAVPEGQLADRDLRFLRVVCLLESLGSPESIQLLTAMTKIESDDFLRRESQSALQRLKADRPRSQ